MQRARQASALPVQVIVFYSSQTIDLFSTPSACPSSCCIARRIKCIHLRGLFFPTVWWSNSVEFYDDFIHVIA